MLLAIDTATRQLSLALHDGQRVIAEQSWRTANYHTVELAPQIALMLRRASVNPDSLEGIAVALGPGSYTGLRIGLGLAKGLAFAHNLPLIGVPTFQIVMAAVPAAAPPGNERALALVQAGRGRVSVAAHYWDGKRWEPVGPARVMDWAALAEEVRTANAAPTLICGEWEAATSEQLAAFRGRAAFTSPAHSLRRAGHLAELGWERLQRGDVSDPATLAPLYTGGPDGMPA
ncbi:MAG: tRNA (adenosine(37)-N6)-threonylcarbamoyltransferase complex dimerization subunit type 1 TsaB [Anaerolineales bacterium]